MKTNWQDLLVTPPYAAQEQLAFPYDKKSSKKISASDYYAFVREYLRTLREAEDTYMNTNGLPTELPEKEEANVR